MKITLGFVLAVFALSAHAKPALVPNYVACISQEALEQMERAIQTKDAAGIRFLSRQCTMTTLLTGRSFSVLDATFTGLTKIRVYEGDDATELWTPSEAVQTR